MPHSGFSGVQNSFVLKPGQVTVISLVEDIGTYHIIYAVGQGLDSQLRDGYLLCLDIDTGSNMTRFISNCAGQHFALCYGDQSSGIEGLAAVLKINVIRLKYENRLLLRIGIQLVYQHISFIF